MKHSYADLRVPLRGMLVLVGLSCAVPARAEMIINGGRTYDEHNRQGAAFIGAGYDWTGVSVGKSEKATMISPSYFLTSNHQKKDPGQTVTFRNADGDTFAYTVDSYTSLLTATYNGTTYYSDLRLGKLTAPLDPTHGIAHYPVVPDGTVFVGEETFMYGKYDYAGKSAPSFLAFTLGGGSTGGVSVNLYYDDFPHAAYMQSGDSSGPSFVIRNGELAVLGIHWGISNVTETPTYGVDYNIDSYVPFYVDQLNARMSGDGEQVTLAFVIPEPTTFVMFMLAGILCLRRGRMRC